MDRDQLRLARNRVATLREDGQFEQALAEVDTALAAMPGDAPLRALRADTLLDLERPEQALQEARALIDEGPGDDRMRMIAGAALLDLGEYREVIRIVGDTAARWPVQPLAREYLVMAHSALGEREEAIAAAQEVLESFPDVPHSHMLMVAALVPAGSRVTWDGLDAAEYHIRAGLDLDPDDPEFVEAMSRLEATKERVHEEVLHLTLFHGRLVFIICSLLVLIGIGMNAVIGFHRLPTAAWGLVLAGVLGWRARAWFVRVPSPRWRCLRAFARWWPAGAVWLAVTALLPLSFVLMAVVPQWKEPLLYAALIVLLYGQLMLRSDRRRSAEDHTVTEHRSS